MFDSVESSELLLQLCNSLCKNSVRCFDIIILNNLDKDAKVWHGHKINSNWKKNSDSGGVGGILVKMVGDNLVIFPVY